MRYASIPPKLEMYPYVSNFLVFRILGKNGSVGGLKN